MKQKNWAKIIKPIFIILLIISTIPSIIYLIQNKTILNFDKYFTILFNDTDRLEQTVIYIIILAIITTLYVLILKNRDKIFKNIKQVYIFIAISATICIFIIPFYKFRYFLLSRNRKIRLKIWTKPVLYNNNRICRKRR